MAQLKETAHYAEFGSCHNIVINEETGFGYAVGTKTCRGGLHMIDLSIPDKPVFAGCYDDDGYTHDAQCVVYRGPDKRFVGQEICFAYNENTLTIVDVTDKTTPRMLSRVTYDNVHYTHQGWLTEDQSHLLLNVRLLGQGAQACACVRVCVYSISMCSCVGMRFEYVCMRRYACACN